MKAQQERMIKRPFMNLDETAEYLGLAKQTIYGYVHQKKLPHLKVNGKKLYFKVEDLDNFIMKSDYIKSDEQIDQEAKDYLLAESV